MNSRADCPRLAHPFLTIISPKTGPTTNYLWQYRLQDEGTGRVKATFVRRFGTFSGVGEIEAIAVDDEFHVYKREGEPGRPHDHSAELLRFSGSADGTDGLEVASTSFGADFPDGLVVAMNSSRRNFVMFRWSDIARAAQSVLRFVSPGTRRSG